MLVSNGTVKDRRLLGDFIFVGYDIVRVLLVGSMVVCKSAICGCPRCEAKVQMSDDDLRVANMSCRSYFKLSHACQYPVNVVFNIFAICV